MLFGEIFNVALGAIRANKLRSFLTALGIVIGVGAVITMVALGSGAQKAVQDRIAALGTNLLTVYAGQSMHRGVAGADRVSLTSVDAEALLEATALSAVVPEIRRSQQVKYVNQNINVNVTGTVPDYVKVNNYTVAAGRMFTFGDGQSRKRVAVLGSQVPEQLDLDTVGDRTVPNHGHRSGELHHGASGQSGFDGRRHDPDGEHSPSRTCDCARQGQ
jgi:putative ABC transport system permease protein